MSKYRVYIETLPGFYPHHGKYSGHVDVLSQDDDKAIERAFKKILNPRTGIFPGGPRSMLRVLRVEAID